jgi:hypothetical protein
MNKIEILNGQRGSGMSCSAIAQRMDELLGRNNEETIGQSLSTKIIGNEPKVKEVMDKNQGRNSHQRQFRKDTYRNF